MTSPTTLYRIPNALSEWPWSRTLSPHYGKAKAESTAWVESFKPFRPKEQAAFNACDFNLLGCLTYPGRDAGTSLKLMVKAIEMNLVFLDFARVACDLMNFYFVYVGNFPGPFQRSGVPSGVGIRIPMCSQYPRMFQLASEHADFAYK
ncbi:hypothetical protein BDQ12DRAFT_137831 [Crucibulum laeve]|uniref:Uncharacterized protein n=1 Tax=Crucibulum laeve TaxID=68775 RepID=A0A5C3LZ74_9AGAR|nr:hypothetical protein BDQ12DRAFT_137831 [Crucibulum laeve]